MNKKELLRDKKILLLSLCVMFIISFALASRIIEIRIWSDKVEYLTREPIFVHYEVKNRGNSPIILSFGLFGEYFKITDEKGHSYANMLLGEYALTDTLQANKSYKSKEKISGRYRVVNAGEYTIVMETPQGGVSPETRSNTLKIEVKNPAGEEKKALDLYLDAQKLDWNKEKDPQKWEQAFYKYLELVDKYPKSVYAPMCLYTALFKAHVIKDKNIVLSVCKRLIENYSESYYVDEAFYNLVGNYKVLDDKAGALEYIRELIKKYPNTKISESAEYWLGKTEKEEF
jgi:TolA-binding protein